MQRAHSSPAPVAETARTPTSAVAPFGERGNQARLERLGNPRSGLSDKLGLLEHASSSFGQLGKEDAAKLAGLNERLAAARAGLGEGDLEALQKQIAGLDSEYGSLVSSTGTIINLQDTGPSDAAPGAFDGVDSYYVNGMTNSLTESMTHAKELSGIRGTNVGLVYNNTQGMGKDATQALGQKSGLWGGRSKEGETLSNALKGTFDKGRKADVVTHSQGGFFAEEAIERLAKTPKEREALEGKLHLNAMGSAQNHDKLPKGFDNATFIDENSDPIAREAAGRLGAGEQRSWLDKLRGRDNTFSGDTKHLQFESGHSGWDAHRPMTYLQNDTVRDHLMTNPFARR